MRFTNCSDTASSSSPRIAQFKTDIVLIYLLSPVYRQADACVTLRIVCTRRSILTRVLLSQFVLLRNTIAIKLQERYWYGHFALIALKNALIV